MEAASVVEEESQIASSTQVMENIKNTNIQKINNYLKIANVAGGGLFFLMGVVSLVTPISFSDFILAIYIMYINSYKECTKSIGEWEFVLEGLSFEIEMRSWPNRLKCTLGAFTRRWGDVSSSPGTDVVYNYI